MFTVLLNVFECEEITTSMVKYAVENNFDSFFMAGCYEIFKIFVGSKTGIQFLIIRSFIAMSYTLK